MRCRQPAILRVELAIFVIASACASEEIAGGPDAQSPTPDSGSVPVDAVAPDAARAAVASTKGQLDPAWFDISTLPSRIDAAKSYGSDLYSTGILPTYITSVKNGGTDFIGSGIEHAHSKGMQFHLYDTLNKYTGGDREAIKTDVAAQNAFLSDIGWILQRYPMLDGMELEEPTFASIPSDGGAANRAFLDDLFTKAKAIVDLYRPTNFAWSFNCPSNSASAVAGIGIDVTFINDHRLFNAFTIQDGNQSLAAYQANIATWKSRLPNLNVSAATYLTWSSLLDACKTKYPAWDDPSCWNQGFFEQVKWAREVGQPVRIFTLGRLGQPASRWPSDTTPGATAAEKLTYLWK